MQIGGEKVHRLKRRFFNVIISSRSKFELLSNSGVTDLRSAIRLDFRQDGRLPPTYFVPSQFGKDAILRDENVFFRKKTFSSSYFLIFPTLKVFCFFAKDPQNEGLKDIFKKYYYMIRILQQIYYL